MCIKILETSLLSSVLNFMCLDSKYYTLITFCIHCRTNDLQGLSVLTFWDSFAYIQTFRGSLGLGWRVGKAGNCVLTQEPLMLFI